MRKTNTIKVLALFVAMVSGGFCAQAQLTNLEQSVFLNANFPVGAFNDRMDAYEMPMNKVNIGTEAVTGFGLGYRVTYRFDIGYGEVSPYFHADFQWNRIRGNYRDMFIDSSCSIPNYFNVPLFLGVNYRYQLTEVFTPFAEFGVGADFLFVTKEGGSNVVPQIKYRPSTSLAWQVGAGCFFGPHVSASLHYSGYGQHVMEYTDNTDVELQNWDVSHGTTLYDAAKQKKRIGTISLRIGFHF